jgi:membrane protease YdiL (CAAX protease family)
MTRTDSSTGSGPRLGPHLRGHLLRFDAARLATHPSVAGRLLLAAVALEVVRLAATRWLGAATPLWLVLPLLLALALVAVPRLAGVKLSAIGLRPWRDWTLTEKSYFVQVVLLANVVFPFVLAAPLRARIAETGAATTVFGVFVPYLAFGFYQELVYRGLVQRELVRRWGAAAGVLVANALYTIGPLHWSYWSSPPEQLVTLLAATFAIGLYFGLVYLRSDNLAMVGVFHAIGNAYIVASMTTAHGGAG